MNNRVTVEPTLAQGWPGRTCWSEGRSVGEEAGPVPGEGALAGPRWFLVWNRDSFGECCCWRGSVRVEGIGGAGSCQRPGKHPWVTRADGQLYGFVHGAADALDYGELADRYGPSGGARQLAVVLEDLVVVDIDGERALRDFARMAFTVPKERILGVSTSPRGYHVWLDCPGWDQKALNEWMRQWLAPQGGWHGTEERKAGRRGFLVDVRTGVNRFAVWPGSSAERRWIGVAAFGGVVSRALVGMPAWRMAQQGGEYAAGPWAVDTADSWLQGWLEQHKGGSVIDTEGYSFEGEASEMDAAWAELERWLGRLEAMPAGSGRNNRLNQVAYYSGAKAVMAGHAVELVRQRLVAVGEQVGTHGVAATVDSGLRSGLATIKKQVG